MDIGKLHRMRNNKILIEKKKIFKKIKILLIKKFLKIKINIQNFLNF